MASKKAQELVDRGLRPWGAPIFYSDISKSEKWAQVFIKATETEA